ncbi:hypothetical protein N7465_008356 [Penicillium sp. CMV-2018d]|nr:hypothetical protein N7465_008356 [Penicillium sp. CMV-2018d]
MLCPISYLQRDMHGTYQLCRLGGVAGAGIIGASVIFLLWKRKSHQQDGLNEPGNIRYESVSKDQSDHDGKGIQQIEANDPVHKSAEAPGSTPHNVSQEAGPDAFIAELPVPDDGKHY